MTLVGTIGAVGGVSVRGSSHVVGNLPNQDAVGHGQEGGWTYLAVADGHGSSRHYRSDRGAQFAVDAVLSLLRSLTGPEAKAPLARALPTLAGDLVAGWTQRVEADIRSWPVRERPGFESLAVYGATCLAVAIGPEASLFLQIGDGDILASGPSGEVDRAIPLDPYLVGPGTYSLCQRDATHRVHLRLFGAPHPLSTPDFVLATTDGLSKSYRRDEEFVAVARHIRDTLRTTDLTSVLTDLEPWLSECSSRGSRDDMTVAIYSAAATEPARA